MFGGLKSRMIEYIIIVNAMFFVLELGKNTSVFAWKYLALTPANVFNMPWTILTSMFMHASFEHILFNMFFGVFMFGTYLERIVGEREFTKVYFLGGIAASLFYVFLSLAFGIPSPNDTAVGASGAVFAVIGALVILRPNLTIYLYLLFPIPLWMFAVGYMIYTVIAIPTDMAGNTAVTAHVGGLLAGLAFGRLYKDKYTEQPQYTYVRYY
jgi:uncharacterized protein